MAYEEITALLGGWPGFDIQTVQRDSGGTQSGAPQITIELIARPDGVTAAGAGARRERSTMSRCAGSASSRFLMPRRSCRNPTVEALPWLDRYARMTKRFAESVARLAHLLPIKQVADGSA